MTTTSTPASTAAANSTTTRKLETFVIPNGWLYVGDLPTYIKEDTLNEIKRTYGVEVQDHDVLISLWTVDPQDDDNSNLECHGLDRDRKKLFSHYAPQKIFQGKREGETVQFTGELGTFEVKLNQSDYRYRRFGGFHEVLKRQIRNAPVGSTYRR